MIIDLMRRRAPKLSGDIVSQYICRHREIDGLIMTTEELEEQAIDIELSKLGWKAANPSTVRTN